MGSQRCIVLAAAIAVGLSVGGEAMAAITYWAVTPPAEGNWFTAGNWTAGVPNLSTPGVIDTGGTATVSSGSATSDNVYLGWDNSGFLAQSGGTLTGRALVIGYNSTAASGGLSLSGGTMTWNASAYVGYKGTGTFTQTGGQLNVNNSSIYLGSETLTSNGTFDLSGTGRISSQGIEVGYAGTGLFRQYAGTTATLTSMLRLGYSNAASRGTYELHGGTLVSGDEIIGATGTGVFSQSGGSNECNYLSINSSSRYDFTAGTLKLKDGGLNAGVWDFANQAVTLTHTGGILDLTAAAPRNTTQAAYAGSGQALLIYAPGFNPQAAFQSFSTSALLLESGGNLTIPAGKGTTGRGTINGHIINSGTISQTTGQTINITGGLYVTGTGKALLGMSGTVDIEDQVSGIDAGGQITAGYMYVGKTGTGRFVQSGGSAGASYELHLGVNAGSQGTYELNGGTFSWPMTLYIGEWGIGTFKQQASSVKGQAMVLGVYAGSTGSYNLGGTGVLQPASAVRVGSAGTGLFTQTGGSVSTVNIYVGGVNSVYSLSGGSATAGQISVGSSTTARFTQSGGTVTASNYLYLGTQSGGTGTYELQAGTLSGNIATLSTTATAMPSAVTSSLAGRPALPQSASGANTRATRDSAMSRVERSPSPAP